MPRKFWNTQPVDRGESKGIIDDSKKVMKLDSSLPDGLAWKTVDNLDDICDFLTKFYVEDITSSYRLSYSKDFMSFLFGYPKHSPEYSMGLFDNNKMIGYIMGREHNLALREQNYKIISVNFLCLDRDYRNLGLASMMIREIRRIANKNGIFQAIFTAEKDYGFSIARAEYYHYPINLDILKEVELISSCYEAPKMREVRNNTRFTSERDFDKIYRLYQEKYKRFVLHEEFDRESFFYNFKTRNDVIYTIFNEEEQEFASFFVVNTKCTESNRVVKRAYLYYWSGSCKIISDCIVFAKSMSIDMFDILDIGSNNDVVKQLDFGEGTGILKYHLYNIKEQFLQKDDIDFILF